MRRAIAHVLRVAAARLYSGEYRERLEVRDEYGICRCCVDIVGDEYAHGIDCTCVQLPEGWGVYVDGMEW